MTEFRDSNAGEPAANVATYFIRVPGSDQLRFTAVGRQALGPRWARYGFSLDTIKTGADFMRVQNVVMCAELQALRDDRNSGPELRAILDQLLVPESQ